jgi:uncharacterized protein (DUF2236 family)
MMRPSSISHRINGERVVLVGWSRAILLQMAHPLIAAGVADHSSFRKSPRIAVRRLRETVRAMLGLTFGGEETRTRIINGILAIHRRVNGTLTERVGTFPAGTRYSAEDPSLVLWVHATLLESTVMAYEATIGDLGMSDRDDYCREAAPIAMALNARAEEVPGSWAQLSDYMSHVRRTGTLAVGPQATEIATALLNGPLTRVVGPLAWANRELTIGWLPSDVRSLYGFSWDARRQANLKRLLRTVRTIRRITPAALAQWPDARRERTVLTKPPR